MNRFGNLQHVYWGKKVRAEDLSQPVPVPERSSFDSSETKTPEEYPAWGGLRYYEPALKATFEDGNRDVVLKYVSHQIDGDTLTLRVKDINADLFVNLVYRVYPKQDIIERHARIENRTPKTVTLESAQSAVWNMPAGTGYRLTHLAGKWAGETQVLQEPIEQGKKVLESRRGNTSHASNPWFAIDRDATEEHGRVWFAGLGWSGNWKFVVEQTPYKQVRVTGGYNDFDFSWPLKPGESLETPPFYGGFTDDGFGEASRLLHRFERDEILPRSRQPKVRPVLYNSWEATEFEVDEPGQTELAEKAAKLGVELFVMDDGWFGARNTTRPGSAIGSSIQQKFPNGLKPLISKVNVAGDGVRPVGRAGDGEPGQRPLSRASRLGNELPGTAAVGGAQPARPQHGAGRREGVHLRRARQAARREQHRVHQVGHEPALRRARLANVPIDQQKEIWVKYVSNVYEIFDRLRAKHPKLEIESCSGGGGRIDLGILQRVDEVWTSDNTEAFDRLRIQEGFTMAYPPKVMMAWVTDVPNMNGRVTPLKYRFLVAMNGSLGIGSNLNRFQAGDTKLATDMIALYKQIRPTIADG